ncbi:MAG TPA: ABC transporter permease [Acetivibrio clariflavus]|nr:ABC transporter permease [Acetivibrio clariflavus]
MDMRNLKYAYMSISKKYILSILIILQVAVAAILTYSVISIGNEIAEDANNILNIFNGKKAYQMKCSLYFTDRLYQNRFNEDEILEAYNLLANNTFEHFYSADTYTWVKEFDGIQKFVNNSHTLAVDREEYIPVNSFYANKNMFNSFKLKTVYGTVFTPQDFEKEEDVIKVMLGYDYKNIYKPGDTLIIYDDNEERVRQAEVVGILEKDSFLLNKVDTTKIFTNLNSYIVIPYIDLDKLDKSSLLKNHDIQIFDLINNSYFLFDKSVDDDKINKTIIDINNKLESLNIGAQIIENVNEYLSINNNMLLEQKRFISIVAIVIITFLSLGMITSMLYSIKNDRKLFGVHILSGAVMEDLLIRMFTESMLRFAFGFFVSIFFIKAIFKSLQIQILIKIFLLLVALCIIISLLPAYKLKKLNVSELIKCGE